MDLDIDTIPSDHIKIHSDKCLQGHPLTEQDYVEFEEEQKIALEEGRDLRDYIKNKFGGRYCCVMAIMTPIIAPAKLTLNKISSRVLSFDTDTANEPASRGFASNENPEQIKSRVRTSMIKIYTKSVPEAVAESQPQYIVRGVIPTVE